MKTNKIKQFCLNNKSTVFECMKVIDNNKHGFALIIKDNGKLIGTVTDGDIRRFILAGHSLEENVINVMWKKPITVKLGTNNINIKELMNKHFIRNIPVIDELGAPCDVLHLSDIISNEEKQTKAVIIAGGEGKRLRPITNNIPKPMIKIGNKPILENIINSLAESGIKELYISTNYKAEVIEKYFKDGTEYGVNITYLKEKKKLGTAGPLSLLPKISDKSIVVLNADVITKTNYLRFIEFHKEHKCVMTVAATQYVFNIPYGVLELSGHYLFNIKEKPKMNFLCNAGIYMIDTEIISLIPRNREYNMTDLMKELVRKGLPIITFPIHEYWIDIGKTDDLKRAQENADREINEK